MRDGKREKGKGRKMGEGKWWRMRRERREKESEGGLKEVRKRDKENERRLKEEDLEEGG